MLRAAPIGRAVMLDAGVVGIAPFGMPAQGVLDIAPATHVTALVAPDGAILETRVELLDGEALAALDGAGGSGDFEGGPDGGGDFEGDVEPIAEPVVPALSDGIGPQASESDFE